MFVLHQHSGLSHHSHKATNNPVEHILHHVMIIPSPIYSHSASCFGDKGQRLHTVCG